MKKIVYSALMAVMMVGHLYAQADAADNLIYRGLTDSETSAGWRQAELVNWSPLESVWESNGDYYFQASSYDAKPYGAMSYLISPVIDLGGYATAYVNFSHSARYQEELFENARLCVWPEGSSQAYEYEIPVIPPKGSWTWVSSGMIDVSEFAGQRVQFGLKYECPEDGNSTWRVTDFCVTEKEEDEDPDVLYHAFSGYNWNEMASWTVKEEIGKGSDIWMTTMQPGEKCIYGSSYYSEPFDGKAYYYSPEIDLIDVKSCKVSFDHAARYQTTLRELCKACVWVDGDMNNAIELEIPVWPASGKWTLVNSGDIDLTSYCGHKIHFGFLYEGSATKGADSWAINNVRVVKKDLTLEEKALAEKMQSQAKELYNMQGMKIEEGQTIPGIYITREGTTVSKSVLR